MAIVNIKFRPRLNSYVTTQVKNSYFIRYSAYADGTDFTDTWQHGQEYVGFAVGVQVPTLKTDYQWARFKFDGKSVASVGVTSSGEFRIIYTDGSEDVVGEDVYSALNLLKQEAGDYATSSKSWAIGDTGTRENEDTNNSKYYAEQAQQSAESAQVNLENLIYYAGQAQSSAEDAAESASSASGSAQSASDSADEASGYVAQVQEIVSNLGVEANPELVGDEDSLTSLKVNGTKYAVTKVTPNPTLEGTESPLTSLEVDGTKYINRPNSIAYITTAPVAENTDGLKIVVLSEEPVTKYSGYLYIITEA